jgi:hypothetical protein
MADLGRPDRRAEEGGGMKRSMTSLVLRFLLIFVLALGALAAVWAFVAPAYTEVIGTVARPLFRLVENPNATVLDVRGAETWVYRIVGEHEIAPFTWFDRYTFFALIPLIALIAATPGLGWRRRLVRGAIGVGALACVHVIYLVVSVEMSYAAMGLTEVGPLAARTLDAWQVLIRILWEAAPVLIWLALTLQEWKRQFILVRDGAAGADTRPTRSSAWGSALGALKWKKREGTP